jgi:hypothetical protein
VQHLPLVQVSPDGQPQKPPQPSVPEPHELLSQWGTQQLPPLQVSPNGQPQLPPQASVLAPQCAL